MDNPTKRICPNCGAEVEGSALFCTTCGRKLPDGEAPKNISYGIKAENEPASSANDAENKSESAGKSENESANEQRNEQPPVNEAHDGEQERAEYTAYVGKTSGANETGRNGEYYGAYGFEADRDAGAKYEAGTSMPAEPKADPKKDENSAPISTFGFFGILLLCAIPVVGPILVIIWACGGCRKKQKTTFARGALLKFAVDIIIFLITAGILFAAFAGHIKKIVSNGGFDEYIDDYFEEFFDRFEEFKNQYEESKKDDRKNDIRKDNDRKDENGSKETAGSAITESAEAPETGRPQ